MAVVNEVDRPQQRKQIIGKGQKGHSYAEHDHQYGAAGVEQGATRAGGGAGQLRPQHVGESDTGPQEVAEEDGHQQAHEKEMQELLAEYWTVSELLQVG